MKLVRCDDRRRWARRLLGAALASLGGIGTAWADGDVTATVDGAGDLWLFGDEFDNSISLRATEVAGELQVFGFDSTTVNGLGDVILAAPGTRVLVFLGGGDNVASLGDPSDGKDPCCFRELTFIGGAGKDRLDLRGPFTSVVADMGPGIDRLTTGEGTGALRSSSIRMGEGDDVVSLGRFCNVIGCVFDLGAGDDVLDLEEGGSATIDAGAGNDTVRLTDVGGAFEIDTREGDDRVELEDFEGGALTVDTGPGADRVHLNGDTSPFFTSAIQELTVRLGADDDRLLVGRAEIVHASYDGGDGQDLLFQLAGNEYEAPPDVQGFELPPVARAPGLAVTTRITGRVRLEDGTPVAGASVALPQLGLLTHTDAAGAFVFRNASTGAPLLEITVGASVRGRPRSGAGSVEITPFGASDAGEIVLARELRNTLVLGELDSRAEPLERLLQRLGARSEEVSRLTSLPPDLSHYGVVWRVGRTALTGEEDARLAAFVRSGRGLHLTGTGAVAELQDFVNHLLRTEEIEIRPGSAGGFNAFNPDALDGVTREPNVLLQLGPVSYAEFLHGLEPRNVLVALLTGEVMAAAWDARDLAGGRGRLTLVMDDLWIQQANLRALENLQVFLAREPELLPVR